MNPFEVGNLEPHESRHVEPNAPPPIPPLGKFVLIGFLCWMVFLFFVLPVLIYISFRT